MSSTDLGFSMGDRGESLVEFNEFGGWRVAGVLSFCAVDENAVCPVTILFPAACFPPISTLTTLLSAPTALLAVHSKLPTSSGPMLLMCSVPLGSTKRLP